MVRRQFAFQGTAQDEDSDHHILSWSGKNPRLGAAGPVPAAWGERKRCKTNSDPFGIIIMVYNGIMVNNDG